MGQGALLGVLLIWAVSSQALQIIEEKFAADRAQLPPSYHQGLEALVRQDLAGAERAFLQASRENPKIAAPLLGLAEVAYQRHDLKASGRYLEQAAALEPANFHVQTSLGRYFALIGQYEQAEAALLKAAKQSAGTASAWIALGDFYSTFVNRPKEAVDAYQEAVKIEPKHVGAHYGLGMSFAKLGEDAKALESLRQAARLETNNLLPWLAIGQVQAKQGQLDQALTAIDQALKIQPGLAPARELRGDVLAAKGDYAAASREYELLLREAPKLANVQVKAGMLYQTLGQLDKAEQSYQAAIAADPKHALAYNNLAWLAVKRQQDLAQAASWAKKAVELAPKIAQFHDTLGWIYRAQGKLHEALNTLAQAAKLAQDDASILYHLGVVQAELGKIAQAKETLQKALATSPNSEAAEQARKLLTQLDRKG